MHTRWIIFMGLIINSLSLFPIKTKKYTSISISGVEDRSVKLPCNMTAVSNDSVLLVLWFKQGVTTPIYSFDLRQMKDGEPKHWWDSDIFGTRAYFNAHKIPAHLLIRHLSTEDTGVYKCRVDFKVEQTRNSRVNLSVIIPPKEVRILDQNGEEVGEVLAGVREGQQVNISCTVKGGNPAPNVTWVLGGIPVSSSLTNLSKNDVKSALVLNNMKRSNVGSIISCQAGFHKAYPPITSSVKIDMYLRPLKVAIEPPQEPISSGRSQEFICQTSGSRPPAELTWKLGSNKIPSQMTVTNGVTKSTFTMVVNSSHHKEILLCEARNDYFKSYVLTDALMLDVFYSPKVKLKIDTDILILQEGEALTLPCVVDSNPGPYKILWTKDDTPVSSETQSVSISNLKIPKVHPKDSGKYKCSASNVEGDHTSKSVSVYIRAKPICRLSKTVRMKLQDSRDISCDVVAYPKPFRYDWFMSKESSENGKKSFKKIKLEETNKTIKLRKSLVDLPKNFWCLAENSLGNQTNPCSIRVLPTSNSRTFPKCAVTNLTIDSMNLICSGMKVTPLKLLIRNVQNKNETNMIMHQSSAQVARLQPDTKYYIEVYSNDSKEAFQTFIHTLGAPVRQLETRAETNDGRSENSPAEEYSYFPKDIGLILGIAVIVLGTTILAFVIYKIRIRRSNAEGTQPSDSDSNISHSKPEPINENDSFIQTNV